jgi:peroxidase
MSQSSLIRLTEASYADGLSQLVDGVDPVLISRTVFDQDGDMPNDMGVSDLFTFWGQFVDHDLSLTPAETPELMTADGLVAPVARSSYDPDSGIDGPRVHENIITAAMDASMVYGSDDTRQAELRSFEGGRLAMSEDGLMPLVDTGMAGANGGEEVFLAGDVRANENSGLASLHTLFAREHNHWADRLATEHPDWSDQRIFEAARSIVEAEIQKITYQDWMPHLVGDAVGDNYAFDADADGRISTEFSTAGFRFGHTLVSSEVRQMMEDGTAMEDISLQGDFFNIDAVMAEGIEMVLRGQAADMAQQVDAVIVDDLNFFLETDNGVRGFSLAALNILRSRDHGLDSYINVRAALLGDIDPETMDLTDFSIITSDADTQARLETAYGTIDKVDLWVGGLAEDHVEGTQLGVTFTYIVADQFERTRAADEGFGAIDPEVDQGILDEIAATQLSDIIMRNTDVDRIQDDVFLAANRMSGTDGADRLKGGSDDDLINGLSGRDMLIGRHGDDTLYGGMGNDEMRGGRDDDCLYGEEGRDKLKGNAGDDELYGGAGGDWLYAGRGNDIVLGEDGNDWLMGQKGEDRLDGGAGYDRLRGGRDEDVFVFKKGNDMDIVFDFRSGEDVIELSGFDGLTIDQALENAWGNRWYTVLQVEDDTLILNHVRGSSLDADDFILA